MPNMSKPAVTAALREEALRLGFDVAGMAQAVPSPDWQYLEQWLAAGLAGQMGHFFADRLGDLPPSGRRAPRAKRTHARRQLPHRRAGRRVSRSGRVSRYAWGSDYHAVIRRRLRRLRGFHDRLLPTARSRGVVDTAPLLERQFGRLAGLGWVGKNTALIHPVFGSWFYLAALLTTEELEYNAPSTADRCGSCRACLDACPTGARRGPSDRRQEVSELPDRRVARVDAGVAPQRLRRPDFRVRRVPGGVPLEPPHAGDRRVGVSPLPGMNPVDLSDLVALDAAAFRDRFRHTSLWRAKRERILRNAAVAVENQSSRHLRRSIAKSQGTNRRACSNARQMSKTSTASYPATRPSLGFQYRP